MPQYSHTLDLTDGIAFASALKVYTDIGDILTEMVVDPIGATAVCTFQQGAGTPVKPNGNPLTYDVSNGVIFAGALKVHTDIQNKLVWIVVHAAAATADCWFV
jgi:hypothetical protein